MPQALSRSRLEVGQTALAVAGCRLPEHPHLYAVYPSSVAPTDQSSLAMLADLLSTSRCLSQLIDFCFEAGRARLHRGDFVLEFLKLGVELVHDRGELSDAGFCIQKHVRIDHGHLGCRQLSSRCWCRSRRCGGWLCGRSSWTLSHS